MSIFGSTEFSWPGGGEKRGERRGGRGAGGGGGGDAPRQFNSLAIRKGHKKSVVALGHKMLRTIYAMLSTRGPTQDKTVDTKP